jgi:NADPH:quinone reductase-like Zn-dependent oxidoreductase
VQIATALGAEVTGVCSTRNVELVRSIGAAHVVDYTTEDFTDGRALYDVVLDNVCNRPLSRLRRALTPTGTLVLNGGGSPGRVVGAVGSIVRAVVVNSLVRERLRLIPHEQKRELNRPGFRRGSLPNPGRFREVGWAGCWSVRSRPWLRR